MRGIALVALAMGSQLMILLISIFRTRRSCGGGAGRRTTPAPPNGACLYATLTELCASGRWSWRISARPIRRRDLHKELCAAERWRWRTSAFGRGLRVITSPSRMGDLDVLADAQEMSAAYRGRTARRRMGPAPCSSCRAGGAGGHLVLQFTRASGGEETAWVIRDERYGNPRRRGRRLSAGSRELCVQGGWTSVPRRKRAAFCPLICASMKKLGTMVSVFRRQPRRMGQDRLRTSCGLPLYDAPCRRAVALADICVYAFMRAASGDAEAACGYKAQPALHAPAGGVNPA